LEETTNDKYKSVFFVRSKQHPLNRKNKISKIKIATINKSYSATSRASKKPIRQRL